MSLSTATAPHYGSGHDRPRPWTVAEDDRLRAALAAGGLRGHVRALARQVGHSYAATVYRLCQLRRVIRAEQAAVGAKPSSPPSQAQLHHATLPRPEEVTRRCVACCSAFLAPSRFVRRCETCRKSHATWTGYDL